MRAKAAPASPDAPLLWVPLLGWTLAACAGCANVVAYRSWGTHVSYMTGTTANLAMNIDYVAFERDNNFDEGGRCLAVLSAFCLGAVACGLLVDRSYASSGGKACYGAALLANSALLVLAVQQLPELLSVCLVAMACGLQNALCTSHLGAVVRTTHVTGIITDVGSSLGRIGMALARRGCRRPRLSVAEQAEAWPEVEKLVVLVPMWLSFVLGSLMGAVGHRNLETHALLLPAGVTGVLGVVCTLFRGCLTEVIWRVEQDRLRRDMAAVCQSLSSTHEYLQSLLRAQGKRTGHAEAERPDREVEEMEAEVLETLRQLQQLQQRVGAIRERSPAPAGPTGGKLPGGRGDGGALGGQKMVSC